MESSSTVYLAWPPRDTQPERSWPLNRLTQSSPAVAANVPKRSAVSRSKNRKGNPLACHLKLVGFTSNAGKGHIFKRSKRDGRQD